MTINELRIKRAQAWEAAKAFLDSHRNTDGILSAEDDATYTRMEQEVTDLGKEIARLERQEAVDRELAAPTSQPLTQKPDNAKPATPEKTGRAADAYRINIKAYNKKHGLRMYGSGRSDKINGKDRVPCK